MSSSTTNRFRGLPQEIQALILLAPPDVSISYECYDRWRVEHEGPGGTSTRWMNPWDHTLEEWAFAINQVRSD